MKDWELIYSGLLEKLKELCAANGIDMFLMDYAALAAVRSEPLSYNEVNVCIDARHAVSLISAIRALDDPGICVESMYDNSRYPRYELRVCDTMTVDCDCADFFRIKNNCMHIGVQLIQRKKGRAGSFISKLWRRAFGASSWFRMLTMTASASGAGVTAGKYCFDRCMFEQKRTVLLYGKEYCVPADADNYLTAQFGSGWQYVQPEEFRSSERHFHETGISWEKWKQDIPAEAVNEYEKTLAEYSGDSREYRRANREIRDTYAVIGRAYSRIQYYKFLAGHRDDLIKLRREGCFDEIELILLPYLRESKKYLDLGMDLFIDDEISSITSDMLRHKGMKEFADKLDKLIPSDKQEIRLVDHLGNPLRLICD